MANRVGALLVLVVVPLAFCGCGANATPSSTVAEAKVSTVDRESGNSTATNANALRTYLRGWEESWRRLGNDTWRITGGGENLDFSATPDATWPRAQRAYEETAIAYRNAERRLTALSPPWAMRQANKAYIAAVRRQAALSEDLAKSFAGTDPATMERAREAWGRSQLQFDQDGARWERAVIAACRASGAKVPKIVRDEYISNGQRIT